MALVTSAQDPQSDTPKWAPTFTDRQRHIQNGAAKTEVRDDPSPGFQTVSDRATDRRLSRVGVPV